MIVTTSAVNLITSFNTTTDFLLPFQSFVKRLYNRYLTTTTTTMDYVYVDSFWLDDWSICFDYEVRVRDLTDDDDDDDNNDNDDI